MFKVLTLVPLFTTLVTVQAAVYTVGVGKDETTGQKGIGFDPSSIHPQAGDTIVFEFRSGDHSAVQSSFENPCTPLEGGFNSGVQTVPDDVDVDALGLPTVELPVNDTQPLWFFDEAGGLCSQGAIFSVNPTAEQTPGQFRENATGGSSNDNSASSSSSSSAPPSTGTSTGAETTGTSSNTGTSSDAPETTGSDTAESSETDAGVGVKAMGGVVVMMLVGAVSGISLL